MESCSYFSQRLSGICDRRLTTERREFPPPLSLLVRTEERRVFPTQTPWVLKWYHTADGRLILREEKVRRQGYFRVNRSNGRLTLQLCILDDVVYKGEESDEEEELEETQNVDSFDEEGREEKESALEEDGGDGEECMDYNSPSFARKPILTMIRRLQKQTTADYLAYRSLSFFSLD